MSGAGDEFGASDEYLMSLSDLAFKKLNVSMDNLNQVAYVQQPIAIQLNTSTHVLNNLSRKNALTNQILVGLIQSLATLTWEVTLRVVADRHETWHINRD